MGCCLRPGHALHVHGGNNGELELSGLVEEWPNAVFSAD